MAESLTALKWIAVCCVGMMFSFSDQSAKTIKGRHQLHEMTPMTSTLEISKSLRNYLLYVHR
jgi:hypothetical protein